MIAKQLFKKIKDHKGPISAAISNSKGVFYIQVSKKDLLVQLSAKFWLTDETGFELDHNGYLDKDYDVA